MTPSAFNTPSGLNSFSPTATPCNSPDISVSSSRAGSPEPYESLSIPQLILSSMPHFLQQTVGGGAVKKKPTRLRHGRKQREVSDDVCLDGWMKKWRNAECCFLKRVILFN